MDATRRATELDRLDALRRYEILDTAPEQDFDDLALLAASCCRAPVGAVDLVDAARIWIKASTGLAPRQVPREGSFSAAAIASPGVLVVPDASRDPRFRDGALVAGAERVRFYAGAPVLTPEGLALGTVCVMDSTPRQLSADERAALEALGRRAASHLELRRTSECRRTLLELNDAIATHRELDRLLHATSQVLGRVIPFDRAALTLYRKEQDVFRIFAFEAAKPSAAFRVGVDVPRHDSPVGWVFDHRRPLLRRDLAREHEYEVERRLAAEGVRSVCMVPLVVGDRCLGTLNIGSYTAALYTERHVQFLQEAANQVALAAANASAYEEIAALKARLQAENVYLQEEIGAESHFQEIVGRSPAVLAALRKIESVAPTDSTVLIFGETGTGKELFARALHGRSHRRDRPLVKVNCGAIPAGLVESELFGHVKGAFTGALQDRMGRFELADGGTLFLDEVSELPPEAQVKLLRVLQEQELEPVGSSRTVRVDVRVIAASNRRLDEAVRAGRFRADLLYRLDVFPVEVPPLRERRSDIPLLVSFFLGRLAKRLGKPLEGVSAEAMGQLAAYPWPGNVRELQNVLERAAILATGKVLSVAEHLVGAGPPLGETDEATLQGVERAHIVRTLQATAWVIEGPRGAARTLGMHPNTLRSRMKRLGIARPPHDASWAAPKNGGVSQGPPGSG